MADKLLIRVYDVGLGDCIYCRIPGATTADGKVDDFHMLIDCGSWSGMPFLEKALAHLEADLPATQNGRKRLDLIVVTHEHKDHIAGFDPALFSNLEVGAVWMNAAMDPDHSQARKTQTLHQFAGNAMRGIAALRPALSPELQDMLDIFQISNSDAMQALRVTLLGGRKPSYVHAGQTNDDLALPLAGATIHVLGPENDIDRFYLGKEADTALRGVVGFAGGAAGAAAPANASPMTAPANIGAAEFKQLRARMQSSAFAFADLSSRVTNNSSVVLLIEWGGKRLLFVGDAEWDGEYREGKSNGAWNVMWRERKPMLSGPVDFLKIGHHGSINATPWNDLRNGLQTEAADILDAILPIPAAGQAPTAQAIVSTERGKYQTIPSAALLTEIGRRVGNTRIYETELSARTIKLADLPKSEFEREWIGVAQPLRTDLERRLADRGFLEVEFSA